MAIIHSPIQPVIESVFASPTQPRLSFFDPDAGDYFKRIMAAGSSISGNNKAAVAEFIIGCKADGIWNAIKASCILAAADTLAGALVPLKGTAPTNVGPFDAGDYSRTTGLVGDGTTKYLNSNRKDNADPRDDAHVSVYQTTEGSTDVARCALGSGDNVEINGTHQLVTTSSVRTYRVHRHSGENASHDLVVGTGFWGGSRVTGTNIGRHNGTNTNFTVPSLAGTGLDVFVFSRNLGSSPTDARISFYSIGESLNLTQLDARLTTLMAAIT